MNPPCPNCQTDRSVVECVKDENGNVLAWCCDYCNLVWGANPDGCKPIKELTQGGSSNEIKL